MGEATRRDELVSKLESLPDDDLEWAVGALRERDYLRGHGAPDPIMLALAFMYARNEEEVTDRGATLSAAWSEIQRALRSGPRLRWPRLGPGAVGAAVVLGWLTGILGGGIDATAGIATGGPLNAMVGAVAGLVIGDFADQLRDLSDQPLMPRA